MAAEGHNVDATLLAVGRDHGHYFVRKTFGKPTYCHHCCDKIWGMLTQGYVCEVCNFICHDKCKKTVVSFCSGVALQLIKNLIAHTWSEPSHIKRRFCCVCRKKTDDSVAVECEVCEYYVHVDCHDLAVSDCKEAATYVPNLDKNKQVQHHHMRESNIPRDSKCVVCRKAAGMKCAHAICYRQMSLECDFGALKKIMLPPNALTIPTSSPVKTHSEDSTLNSPDQAKEKQDYENLRIFDGNSSLRKYKYRTAIVPKIVSIQQIRDVALRRFHISDNPDCYYVTQVHNDNGEEELLEDPLPLRNVRRPEGCRAQIFLRYKDDPEKAIVKLYGGWLRQVKVPSYLFILGKILITLRKIKCNWLYFFRVPVTCCSLLVTKVTLVQDAVAEALDRFGLDRNFANRCNVIEVSLDCGVAERIDSLRRYHVVQKDDPHDHAVFVGNLPLSLAQRQYERILLRLLGAKVITFNTEKAATSAVQRLQNAVYEEKKLIVLCLPNVQVKPHMLSPDCEPLLVLVNVKSELIKAFRRLLNPFQVFDVLKGGPLVGLYVFRNVPKYKILVCDGDSTVGWVLQCLDIAKQDAACFSPLCSIVPLGTGNDLARVLRWGAGYSDEENPMDILRDVIEAEEVRLDRWAVVFHDEERSQPPTTSNVEPSTDSEQMMSNPEDQTSMFIMNNYFGIGIDEDVYLQFHNMKDANPEKFSSRLFNKTQYVKIGLQKVFFERTCKDLWRRVELEVDGQIIELPCIEGIIVLNLLSWGSGANPWGTAKEEGQFQKPTHYDGLLEVVDISDVSRLGLVQSKLIRIAQGGSIRITTHEEWPVQMDGEPHIQPPGTITILKSAFRISKSVVSLIQIAKMLKKAKKSRRNAISNVAAVAVQPVRNEASPSSSRIHPCILLNIDSGPY
uniref:Diacylglycerol kinase n=1 Tax=Brugia malayi TaxID=6279 RepID=A0A0H5S3N7_BRUMA|nr:Bm305 [Brugia malayi]